MRRGLLTLVVLLGASSIAAAQTQFFAFSGPPAASKVSADEVVARFMTFDSNGDGRIAVAELSERLRPLVSRGDTDGDNALDRLELHALAAAPVTPTRQVALGSGSYGFGDDSGLSSRTHIEGALQDLRLTSDKTERALPMIRTHLDTVEVAAKADLLRQMEPLLSPQQLEAFTSVLNAQSRRLMFKTNGNDVPVVRTVGSADLAHRVQAMHLAAPKDDQAQKAIDDFKVRMRLGRETERTELLSELKNVLNDGELDDFGAALERRPVVANSFSFALVNDVVRMDQQSGRVVFVGDALPAGEVSVR